jgi:hypothetical protein
MHLWTSPRWASRAAGLLIALLMAMTARAGTVGVRPGVYKNVKLHEETGDLLGMAVEIRERPTPRIVVTIREGECFGGKAWPFASQGPSFTFTTCDALRDQNGRPAPCRPVHYSGRVRADGSLLVMITGQPETRLAMRRVARPEPREVEQLACMNGRC